MAKRLRNSAASYKRGQRQKRSMAADRRTVPPLTIQIDESIFDAVRDEDKATMRNLIYVLEGLCVPVRIFHSWSLLPVGKNYEVTAILQKNFQLTLSDLLLLQSVDELRVRVVTLEGTPELCQLKIVVTSKGEPITLSEQEFVCIRKKRWRVS